VRAGAGDEELPRTPSNSGLGRRGAARRPSLDGVTRPESRARPGRVAPVRARGWAGPRGLRRAVLPRPGGPVMTRRRSPPGSATPSAPSTARCTAASSPKPSRRCSAAKAGRAGCARERATGSRATASLSGGPASSQARNQAASVDDMSSTVARLGGGVIHGRTGQRWTSRREVSVPGHRETSHERWASRGERLRPTCCPRQAGGSSKGRDARRA
jgi:hypothetical protein